MDNANYSCFAVTGQEPGCGCSRLSGQKIQVLAAINNHQESIWIIPNRNTCTIHFIVVFLFVSSHGASVTDPSLTRHIHHSLCYNNVTIVFSSTKSRGGARYSESQGRKTKSDKYHFYRFLICASCHCSEKVAENQSSK